MRSDRNIATKMRKQGYSYNDIYAELGVPKSTLSGWFKDNEFSYAIREKNIENSKAIWASNITQYNKNRSEQAKVRAKQEQALFAKDISILTERELMIVGTALYWAEGDKKNRWRLHFANSDAQMIKLMMCFLYKTCNVDKEKIKAWVQSHPKKQENKLLAFWSDVSGIPKKQFHKTQYSISSSSKLKRPYNTLPYGTLHILVYDVKKVNMVRGWIKGLSDCVNTK